MTGEGTCEMKHSLLFVSQFGFGVLQRFFHSLPTMVALTWS
jgi:hypothetical protein